MLESDELEELELEELELLLEELLDEEGGVELLCVLEDELEMGLLLLLEDDELLEGVVDELP